MNKLISITLTFLLAISFLSCEKEKNGTVDPTLSPPLIISAALRDSTLNLDTTSTNAIIRTNGQFTISDSIIVQVNDQNGLGDINQVSYRIYKPNSSFYFTYGTLNLISASANTALYSRKFSFTMNRAEAGYFKIEVSAQGKTNLSSSSVLTSLIITRNNSSPHIENVIVPDTVYLPPGDSILIKMTATVSDSDGLSDINEVFFYSLNSMNPTQKFYLFDDGGVNSLSGDALAGDGIYTITVKLKDSPNIRRTFHFEFHADDNEGAQSNAILDSLTVR